MLGAQSDGANWGVITVSVLAPLGFLILLALVALYLQRARQNEPLIKEVGKEGLLGKDGKQGKK